MPRGAGKPRCTERHAMPKSFSLAEAVNARRKNRSKKAVFMSWAEYASSGAEKLSHFFAKEFAGDEEAQGENDHADHAQRTGDARGIWIDAAHELVNHFCD